MTPISEDFPASVAEFVEDPMELDSPIPRRSNADVVSGDCTRIAALPLREFGSEANVESDGGGCVCNALYRTLGDVCRIVQDCGDSKSAGSRLSLRRVSGFEHYPKVFTLKSIAIVFLITLSFADFTRSGTKVLELYFTSNFVRSTSTLPVATHALPSFFKVAGSFIG
jgi:hypothetical protein